MNVNTRSHLLATYSKMNVNVENAKQRIGNWKQIDSRKKDECCISEEGKTALGEKLSEVHNSTLPHITGKLSNESLHEEMEKEIEDKYDNLREEEYFVSQNGTIEKLTKEKELELLHFAYESHKTLMRNSIEIWEKKGFLC